MSDLQAASSLREQKKVETRRALSRAAAELLLSEGSEGMTVAAVAGRAGVSTRTFHNYFPRREDALLTFIEDTIGEWCTQVEHAPVDESPLEVMHRLIADRVDRDADGDDPDPGTLLNLMAIADHLSYVTGREDKIRVKHLADGLLDALYARQGHSMSRQSTALLMVSCLAAGALAVEATRPSSDAGPCLSSWATDPERSATEILDEGIGVLRDGFGG